MLVAALVGLGAAAGALIECSGSGSMWHRRIAIAPAAGPTGIAILSELCSLCQEERHSTVDVRAICRNKAEAAICKQAVCGAICDSGVVSDLCTDRFPALSTCVVPVEDAYCTSLLALSVDDGISAGGTPNALVDTLRGVTTLVVLADDVHPVLRSVEPAGEPVVTTPSSASYTTTRCLSHCFELIDAAAASGVQHVILHSSLGASGPEATPLQAARMGGSSHLALRRRLEDRLKEYCERSREEPGQPLMRHTILQAAPYANRDQLDERRRRQQQQCATCEWGDADERPSGSAAATSELDSAPLTSPATLAQAAVSAALYTRPNTLRRLVTRQVITTAV